MPCVHNSRHVYIYLLLLFYLGMILIIVFTLLIKNDRYFIVIIVSSCIVLVSLLLCFCNPVKIVQYIEYICCCESNIIDDTIAVNPVIEDEENTIKITSSEIIDHISDTSDTSYTSDIFENIPVATKIHPIIAENIQTV